MPRKAVNEIIPGRLYQRGQILTWKYDEKIRLFEEYNIGLVVNFWPKIDPDLSDMWYLHLPSGSDDMIDNYTRIMVKTVAKLLEPNDMAALILCEAGKTRSVFFATLVYAELMHVDTSLAYKKIARLLPTNKLKPFMIDYFHNISYDA